MGDERRAIDDPLDIDFGDQAFPPLHMLFQPSSYTPAGELEQQTPWTLVGHTPWYREVVLTLSGEAGTAVLYLIPITEETILIAACLDDAFEPFFQLVSGDDFGDPVTMLMAQHWPDVYAMLVRGNAAPATGMNMLLRVVAQGRRQWIIAKPLESRGLESIPGEAMIDVIDSYAQTLMRVTHVGLELPGVIQVLGGPDQASRRLTAMSGLIGAGSTIAGVLDGGIDGGELTKLAKASKRALSSVIALKD